MRNLIGVLVLIFCLGATKQSWAQPGDHGKSNIIEQSIETIAEANEDEEVDYTTLFDDLSYFFEHPIDLNRTTQEELQSMRLLNDFQINALLDHIDEQGKLLTIYELQSIDGFDVVTIRNIMPFAKVGRDFDAPNISLKDMLKNGNHELFIRYTRVLEEQEGFLPIADSVLAESPNKRYLGDPNKIYTRYRFKFRQNVSWGFTAEKDAGEEFFKGSQPTGFDYYSAHFFLRGFGKLKALAIGDYQAQFGQGLTFWSGLAFGKSADIMGLKRNAKGLKAYTSVDENLFMRGAGTTVGLGKFEFTAFYSNKKIDANISDADTLDADLVVTSFQTTGLHSTPSELFDRDAIQETYYGGNFAYKSRNLSIGLTAVHGEYGGDLQRSLSEYNQFEYAGADNTTMGLDYNFLKGNFNFFGEVARSSNGGIAYLNGALISLDPRFAVSVFHRHYGRDYHALLSAAVAESSRNVNEKGLYMGFIAKPHRYVTFTSYFDRYEFAWMRYQANAPSQGHEFLSQLNYKPSKKLEMYFRVRKRNRPKNTPEDIANIDFIVSQTQVNYRYQVSYKISDAIRLKNRVEYTEFQLGDNEAEQGFLIYQDVAYKALSKPWSLNFRYALFESDTYNSRIYAYESDVLYAFSIPAYAYRGTRTYLTFRYTIRRGVDLWLRYGQWFYNNRDIVGSGLTEIQGNSKSDFKAQLRLKF
jgi:hypothetical protein